MKDKTSRIRADLRLPLGLWRLVAVIAGAALVLFAVIVPGGAYSDYLTGGAKDLSWGPTLFRLLLAFHGGLLLGVGFFRVKAAGADDGTRGTGERIMRPGTLAALALLTLTALILRLWNLNSDLWVDEVLTLVDFVRRPLGEIVTSFPNQNQHMLYSILARFSFDLFGENSWALRLPAVLFGVGSIWTLYLFGQKVLGKREALLACALMTVSYHHIWFSQNARGYTGLLFFTLLATWLWLEAQAGRGRIWWIAYAAAVVGGMWVHMTMAFVVAAHGLVHLALLARPKLAGSFGNIERRAGVWPFAAWALSLTATLQLYALVLPEFLSTGLHEESRNSEWTNPLWVVTESLENLSIGFAGLAVVLLGGVFVAFGWLSIFNKDRRAAALMILPPILSGVTMLAFGHNLFPRFFFFSMGFGLLIVAHGAVELPRLVLSGLSAFRQRERYIRWAATAFAATLIIASLATVPRNYAMPKQDFSGAKAFIENTRSPNSRIVAVGIAGDMYRRYFAPEWQEIDDADELRLMQDSGADIWLVYTLSPEIKAFNPELWQVVKSHYEIVRTFPGTLNGGEIFVCRNRRAIEENNESVKIRREGQGDLLR